MTVMTVKKVGAVSVLAAALLASSGAALAAAASPSSAKVTVTATVVESTCTAGWDTSGVEVNLGKVSTTTMAKKGDIGASKPFSLSLTGCSDISNVNISASGTADATDNQAFANTGTAKGVAVELFGGDGQTGQLLPNNSTSVLTYPVTNGTATLSLLAKLERTAADDAQAADFAAGEVNSVANLNLTYE